MGVQQLFLYHHRRRTHLEGDSIGLSAAYDSRYCAGISWQIRMGICNHGAVHGTRDTGQPRADDLLLSVHHSLHGAGLSVGCRAKSSPGTVWQGYWRVLCGCRTGRCHQPFQPLPHLAVHPGVDARKERAGEEELCQPDKQRSRPRLHHSVELWHRRDMDPARTQHQGRSVNAACHERKGYAESRPAVLSDLPATGTVLGQPARHKRSGICWSLCADAVRTGSVHRQRTDEVGAVHCYLSVDTAVVGPQLHVVYRPFPRLCAYVCQVPNGGFDTRDSRIHHSVAGNVGA